MYGERRGRQTELPTGHDGLQAGTLPALLEHPGFGAVEEAAEIPPVLEDHEDGRQAERKRSWNGIGLARSRPELSGSARGRARTGGRRDGSRWWKKAPSQHGAEGQRSGQTATRDMVIVEATPLPPRNFRNGE